MPTIWRALVSNGRLEVDAVPRSRRERERHFAQQKHLAGVFREEVLRSLYERLPDHVMRQRVDRLFCTSEWHQSNVVRRLLPQQQCHVKIDKVGKVMINVLRQVDFRKNNVQLRQVDHVPCRRKTSCIVVELG